MRISETFLYEQVQDREKKNSFRTLKIVKGTDFYSNDYLGFAQSSQIIERFQKKILDIPQLGAKGSRLLGGQHSLHQTGHNSYLENKPEIFQL